MQGDERRWIRMGADVAGRDGDKEDVPGNGDAVEKEAE
jgi:hypothetical protein